MPGMSVVCDVMGGLKESESKISRSLDGLIHNDRYERTILLNERFYFLGYTKYEEYPVTVLETGEVYVCLEGHMYGKSRAQIIDEISQLAEGIFRPQAQTRETVRKWLVDTDGDFLVFMLHKGSREIAILNDALGRLPLYYCEANGKVVVGRELRFITNLVSGIKCDKMGIAQYLLFRHSLGPRTLLENVKRLAPANLIRVSIEKRKIEIQRLHEWNLEEKKHRGVSLARNASQLVSLFSEACRNRTDSSKRNVVSLSGGLDSRSVAACLYKNRIPFSAATFLDSAGRAEADARIAEQLARALRTDWRLFHLSPPKGRDLLRLLKAKGGLNSLEMAFILPFFDKIIEAYGSRVTYFTGDGGGRLKPPPVPTRELRGLDDVVDWIVSGQRGRLFPLDDVCALTGVHGEEIIDEVKECVERCPERAWKSKYEHYRFFERSPKVGFEGEDRNRFFFWSVTPFFAVQFFDYVMNCPDEQKARYVLYHDFLSRLCRQAADIPDLLGKLGGAQRARLPGFVALSRSLRSGRLERLGRMLRSRRRSRGTGVVDSAPMTGANSTLVNCLMAQMDNCEPVLSYLSRAGILEILGDRGKRGQQPAALLTIASTIEAFECGTSSIERYSESEFV